MAESTVCRTKRDITLAIRDGAAEIYTVAYEVGDFSLETPRESQVIALDRGQLGAVPCLRKGDDQPMTMSWTAYERDIYSTTDATLQDILVRPAGSYVAANWVSTMGSSSDEFTVSVDMTVDGASFGEADKTLTMPFTVLRGSRADGDPNTTSVSGTSYALIYTVS